MNYLINSTNFSLSLKILVTFCPLYIFFINLGFLYVGVTVAMNT